MQPDDNNTPNYPADRLPDFDNRQDAAPPPPPPVQTVNPQVGPDNWQAINSEYTSNPAVPASPTRQVNGPLPGEIEPKRVIPWKKIILIPSVVVAVILLIIAGFGAWTSYSQDQAAKKVEAARNAAEEERLKNMANFPLAVDATGPNMVWGVLTPTDGWTTASADSTIQGYENKSLESSLRLMSVATGSSLTATTDASRSAEYLAQQAALVKSELKTESNMKFTDSSKKTVEFATGQFVSKNADGKNIKTRVAVRATAGTIYAVRYDAIESKFSDEIWGNITSKLVLKGNFL